MYIGIEKKIFWEVIIFLLYGHVCPNPEPECLLQGATSFTILIEDYTDIMTIFSIFPPQMCRSWEKDGEGGTAMTFTI